jgi:hypothetical protein
LAGRHFGAFSLNDLVRSNHLGHAEVLSNLTKLGGHASGSGTVAASNSNSFVEAARWRELARDAREIANTISLRDHKQKLLEMAENYEQLAKSAEANS